MTHEERKALLKRICNFYYDSAKKSIKTTVNYFKRQDVPQSTMYYLLKKSIYNMKRSRICHEVLGHSICARKT